MPSKGGHCTLWTDRIKRILIFFKKKKKNSKILLLKILSHASASTDPYVCIRTLVEGCDDVELWTSNFILIIAFKKCSTVATKFRGREGAWFRRFVVCTLFQNKMNEEE